MLSHLQSPGICETDSNRFSNVKHELTELRGHEGALVHLSPRQELYKEVLKTAVLQISSLYKDICIRAAISTNALIPTSLALVSNSLYLKTV